MLYNFDGGPGALPAPVIAQAQQALGSYAKSGLSILGLSHRSAAFRAIVDEAEANLRQLLDLPAHYRIVFLQGGASLQFSMIPMTLLRGASSPSEYLITGYWSEKAVIEARKEGEVTLRFDGRSEGFTRIPTPDEARPDSEAAYLHYVSNETVEGVQFPFVPEAGEVPLVVDMSSDFLSQPLPMDRFLIVYAHAQKNLGPAGVTVVILQEDVLKRVPDGLPAMLDYRNHVNMGSVYNTPPVFAIYVTMLVTRWLLDDIGGLDEMRRCNEAKACQLYQWLDENADFAIGHAEPGSRSLMNATFRLRRRELEPVLVAAAEKRGLIGIGGHRSLGGLRVSLYNAVSREAVEALCQFLKEFERAHR